MLFGSHDDSESHVMLLNWSQRSSRVTLLLVLTGQALMTHACVLAIFIKSKRLSYFVDDYLTWILLLNCIYFIHPIRMDNIIYSGEPH